MHTMQRCYIFFTIPMSNKFEIVYPLNFQKHFNVSGMNTFSTLGYMYLWYLLKYSLVVYLYKSMSTKNLPNGILLTVILFACTVITFASMIIKQYFENGIQFLRCCICIVLGMMLLNRKFSTVRYKILC